MPNLVGPSSNTHAAPSRRGRVILLTLVFIVAVIATLLVTWVLIVMFGRKQEARVPFVRLVEVS